MTYPILFIYIPNVCTTITHYQLSSDKSSFSFVTHSLLLRIFFITNLLSFNSIHRHPHNLYFLQNLLGIPYYVSEGPSLFFYSLTFICYLYFYFFILNMLICEGFWTRRPTVHNTMWEGHWFIVDHCWLRK